jgi:hypothetical protein
MRLCNFAARVSVFYIGKICPTLNVLKVTGHKNETLGETKLNKIWLIRPSLIVFMYSRGWPQKPKYIPVLFFHEFHFCDQSP